MNAVFATVAALSITGLSLAIVVPDESQYIERPLNAHVGKLRGGSCVPIGAKYALTANHVHVARNHTLEVDGVTYTVSGVHPHPEAPSVDLKVIEIAGPPYFPEWVPLHPDPNGVPAGTPVYIGGWGKTNGASDGECIDWSGRRERWAMNTLEGHVGDTWAWYRFDLEQSNEGIAAVYDSGSFLGVADNYDCAMMLLGIASSATSGSTGPSCDNHTAHYVQVDPLWLLQFSGPVCDGDLDADGDTDVNDFSILIRNFGNVVRDDCTNRANGDLNRDGVLDINDVTLFISDFGCAG